MPKETKKKVHQHAEHKQNFWTQDRYFQRVSKRFQIPSTFFYMIKQILNV